ncbi:DUF305 domain-containing protein [Microbacterium sp. CFBP9034]|uniref:DUF305 domain-containing protein n=1 Tax=Microbacterium sp. CFBP9034 TaxID=3096540 RepID=UPI002A69C9E2|nr:DUF305 domain-containing protein [Microbacterium sp. CFBP9034]MDY0910628.1 DUF305 domain-containing protein [Microbacterium sp. CFBP9034]
MILAVTVGFAGLAAVALGMTVPEDTAPTAPPVAAAASGPAPAGAAAYPTIVDHCYIEGMIPHHEQALELSRLVLSADGVRERTRALADFIVADQSAEVGTMNAWQEAWIDAIPVDGRTGGHGGHAADDPAGIPAGCGEHADHTVMKGMASADELAALDAAEGPGAERLFLELMIVHHEGALEMATTAVLEGSNAFVRTSAKHVLVEQDREITAMNALLADLP